MQNPRDQQARNDASKRGERSDLLKLVPGVGLLGRLGHGAADAGVFA